MKIVSFHNGKECENGRELRGMVDQIFSVTKICVELEPSHSVKNLYY